METTAAIVLLLFIMTIQCLPYFAVTYIIYKILKTLWGSNKRTKINSYFATNIVDDRRKQDYEDVSKEVLNKMNISNIMDLKKHLYTIFEEFEYAIDQEDFKEMKRLSTPQNYNNYHTSMTLNKDKKRYIKNIQRRSMIIFELDTTSVKQSASAMIEISYNSSPVTTTIEKFEVIFRKDYKKDITNCPNCGAPLKGNKCEFCNSEIDTNDFKIHNIKKIIK